MKQKIEKHFRDLLDHPEPSTLPQPHRGLRLVLDVWPLLLRKIKEDNLPMMASALTYRMIFGLVPMVVLALLAFKGFVGMDKIEQTVVETTQKMFDVQAVQGAVDDDKADSREQITAAIHKACVAAGNVDLKSVGVTGILLLVWAAVSLIVTAEKIFNTIYRSPFGRPWLMRIPIYWAAMTLGPLFMAGSIYASQKCFAIAHDYVGDAVLVGPLLRLAGSLMSTAFIWMLLCILYKTLPSVRVGLRPAMIGAAAAALAIQILIYILLTFVFAKGKSPDPAKTALYGSLALLPVALLWTYISWFIVLAGLEVAWIVQSLGFLQSQANLNRARHAQELLAAESAMLMPAMVAVGQAFLSGKAVAEAQLCRTLHAPGDVVRPLMDKLVKAGFLHDVLGDDGNADGFRDWGLARPPERIQLEELMALLPVPNPEVPGVAVMKQSREAQINAVKGMTLADAL